MNNETKKGKLVPELRFPGFEGEWEETILSDILRERNEQYPENEDYPLMAFVANVGVCPKGDRYDRGALVKDAKSKKYKRTKLGDFIYSSNNLETGSIGQNHFGNACISPVYSIFEINDKYDNFFIGTLLTKKEFISKMVQYRQGVIYGQWKIHETEFLKLTVSVPSLPEQQKIAECLSSVDDLIRAEADQLQALKDHKKGLVQQLFPIGNEQLAMSNGNPRIPRLRFPGFEGEWEEKKLGEVAVFQNGYAYNSNTFSKEGNYVIRISDIHDGIVSLNSAVHSTSIVPDAFKVLKGDILIAMSGATTGKVGVYNNDESAYINQRVGNIKPFGMNKILLFFLFQSDSFVRYLNEILTAGAQPNISSQQICAFKLLLPSLPEQQKIADCLSSLDEGIAVQQQKVEALKEHKKGLMQKLFPNLQ